jgi:hypothetical protein
MSVWCEREAGLRVRVDQDREHRRQLVLRVVLADRHPLARRRFGLLDVRRHHLPLAPVAVEDDVALRLHVDAPEPVHPVRVLDAVDVLAGGQQADHVRPAENQGLAVAPALDLAGILRVWLRRGLTQQAELAAVSPGTDPAAVCP